MAPGESPKKETRCFDFAQRTGLKGKKTTTKKRLQVGFGRLYLNTRRLHTLSLCYVSDGDSRDPYSPRTSLDASNPPAISP
ncbi:hypothetical protein AJ78_04186 [Emergomyces pasteurianus Ep9510]|uniref:Uncharacterized protein n=1 Tax=Emergomyces pasteurianus Ep9510 TaxID=1447872 RepID=A0A1J9Q5R3_9EURO|nr:hypothetical protein AJ78_04186 [Emergomyces pasteurianus Ep9510]